MATADSPAVHCTRRGTATGVSLWLAARTFGTATSCTRCRSDSGVDVRQSRAYATSIVPEQYRIVYGLNPAVAFIEGTRWAISHELRNVGDRRIAVCSFPGRVYRRAFFSAALSAVSRTLYERHRDARRRNLEVVSDARSLTRQRTARFRRK